MQQFICTVSSNEGIFKGRPQDNPTTSQLISYILKQEIMATAHLGSYSGSKLQICFCETELYIVNEFLYIVMWCNSMGGINRSHSAPSSQC